MKYRVITFIGISAVSIFSFQVIARSTLGHKIGGNDQTKTLPPNARAVGEPTLTEQHSESADLAITARISGELTERKILSANTKGVRILTTGGKVVLMGEVVSAEQKRLIGDVANRIQRRENVDNQLAVKPLPTAPSAPTGLRVVQ